CQSSSSSPTRSNRFLTLHHVCVFRSRNFQRGPFVIRGIYGQSICHLRQQPVRPGRYVELGRHRRSGCHHPAAHHVADVLVHHPDEAVGSTPPEAVRASRGKAVLVGSLGQGRRRPPEEGR